MTFCKFCDKFSHANQILNDSYDVIISETENFVVVPTMGSLVEGWVLIVSKSHNLSCGELEISKYAELQGLVDQTKKKLECFHKDVFVFEHGPAIPMERIGCGVDHLHIHVVPLKFDLYKNAQKASALSWKKVESIVDTKKCFEHETSYLFIETPKGERYISCNNEIPSQFFRRLIADELNISDKFDWKLNYGSENLEKTITQLSTEQEFA